MDTGKLFLGVLAGVATGAILGILFAPAKGSDTRKKISKTGEDFTDDIKDKFNEFINGISEKFEKAKEEASEYKEKEKI